MKRWQETAAILYQTSRLAERGARAALAAVVRISGSAYRRPGARFLVEEDGTTSGGVSGGCLEAEMLAVRAGRQPAHLRARQGSIHEG